MPSDWTLSTFPLRDLDETGSSRDYCRRVKGANGHRERVGASCPQRRLDNLGEWRYVSHLECLPVKIVSGLNFFKGLSIC